MANPDHVQLISADVSVWNHWRSEQPHIKPDLSGIEIENHCLDKINLENSDISGARLIGSSFRNANLDHVKLNYSNICGSDFTDASLRNAYLFRTNAQVADFPLRPNTTMDDLLSTSLAARLTEHRERSIFSSFPRWSAMGPSYFGMLI